MYNRRIDNSEVVPMSISKYQVFLKVVSCGSFTFTKAAEALNFTQSGISHAITSLESELGWASRCSAATGAAWC